MSSQPLSAIIIDDGDEDKIVPVLRSELKITRVKKFTSEKAALKVIKHFKNISLVFIDHDCCAEDSFSFVQQALMTENCAESKFVLLATNTDKGLLKKAADNGFSALIAKPVRTKKLIDKIAKLIPPPANEEEKSVNILESVEATLRYKEKSVTGGIEDINNKHCVVRIKRSERIGVEVYDVVTIRIKFGKEKLGANVEVIKLEKDSSGDQKAVRITLRFKKPNEENAMQFAKFWAYILKERERI